MGDQARLGQTRAFPRQELSACCKRNYCVLLPLSYARALVKTMFGRSLHKVPFRGKLTKVCVSITPHMICELHVRDKDPLYEKKRIYKY